MVNIDRNYLGKLANENGFIRDTFEKVVRLVEILEYINTHPNLKDHLGLKGGTAINLFIFDLPRLSVDIDLDYMMNNSKDEMLIDREIINKTINEYMISQGYVLNLKTRNHHSLDSMIFDYKNIVGNKDNIKIEINYSLRSHIFDSEAKLIINRNLIQENKILILSDIEIFGSKINALLNRAAARDLYDVRNMILNSCFQDIDKEKLRKCIVFYAAISAKDKNSINKNFDTSRIDLITARKIRTDLKPVITTKDDFELESAKRIVKKFIDDLMTVTLDEKEFMDLFEKGEYRPELLFSEARIRERLINHPMALWKLR